MPALPDKDKITARWLVDHLPVLWLVPIIGTLGTAFAVGSYAGRLSAPGPDANELKGLVAERDTLRADIATLTVDKLNLQTEITRLKVDRDVQKKTPDQVREAVKAWNNG
jgi:hypothetical protein